jgi:hypothetical protein
MRREKVAHIRFRWVQRKVPVISDSFPTSLPKDLNTFCGSVGGLQPKRSLKQLGDKVSCIQLIFLVPVRV